MTNETGLATYTLVRGLGLTYIDSVAFGHKNIFKVEVH